MACQNDQAGGPLLRLISEPQDFLASVVLGNTLSNSIIVAVGLGIAHSAAWPAWLALPCIALFILLGCEVLPKALAVRAPERWAKRVAVPMLRFEQLTRALRRAGQNFSESLLKLFLPRGVQPQPALTDEEYSELLELACAQGILALPERDMMLNIVSLDRRTARDIMRPRTQMACIPDTLSTAEMADAARKLKHRRVPVYDESPDTIVGILNTQALLLNPDADLAEALEIPSFVPASMNLLQLFKSLQRQKRGMAIVVDEFGGTAGVVRMEDVLEEIVGRIREQLDTAELGIKPAGQGRWFVSGAVRIEEFGRQAVDLGEVTGVETVAGLMVKVLEVVPAEGQTAVYNGVRMTASKVDARRVLELMVEVLPNQRVKGESHA